MAYKLILAAFLTLSAGLSWAENVSIGGGWGGLHNSDSSMAINDTEAQDLKNVDLTDSGFGVKKRAGYAQFRTIGTSTWAVRGGYYFRDASGADELVYANGTNVYKSINSGAFSAFITTDTAGSYYDFSDSNGWLYRTNSASDQFCRYNGTTLAYSTTAPRGTICEMLSDRMLISGNTTYPNRLYYSAQADPMEYTTGILESSAFTYDHGLPGAAVTAVKAWNNGVLVWTKNTLSYVVYDSQFDLTPVSKISGTIGTLQPYTVVDDYGVIYFQAQDKHWYSFDGNGLAQISNPVDVSRIVSGQVRNWTTSTQSEFNDGTYYPGVSSNTTIDSIILDKVIKQETEDFAGGRPCSSACGCAQSFNPESNFILSYINVSLQPYGNPGNLVSTWTISTDYLTTLAPDGCPQGTALSTATILLTESLGKSVYNLSFNPPVSVTAGTTYYVYLSSKSAGAPSLSDKWNINVKENTNPYIRGQFYQNGSAVFVNSDIYFDILNSSSLYKSKSGYSGTAITAWGPFDVNNVLNGGAISYGIYGDSNTVIDITNSATFTSSQTITSGSIPAIATAPYVTWVADFSRTVSTQTPTLNDVTVNWYEGTPTTHFGAVDNNHRLVWAVAEGTTTAPNVSYLYDQRFNAWLKYDFPFQAPVRVGESMYFGGVSTGVVYNWPSGNTDNGSAFTAYWKSKDFIGSGPYIEKDYGPSPGYSIVAKSQTGSNIDFSYTVNTSTTISRNYSLTDVNGNTLRRINENFKSGTYGTFFNFKFGNDDGDAPFEIYAVGFEYKPKPWRVMQ